MRSHSILLAGLIVFSFFLNTAHGFPSGGRDGESMEGKSEEQVVKIAGEPFRKLYDSQREEVVWVYLDDIFYFVEKIGRAMYIGNNANSLAIEVTKVHFNKDGKAYKRATSHIRFNDEAGIKCENIGRSFTALTTKNIRPEMVVVKGGCFVDDPHNCVEDFQIDKTEVTQEAYQRVVGSNPSNFTGCPTCPVEQVSWNDASAYCEQVGKRLPSVWEWKYAATSGGKQETFAGTSDEGRLGEYAWYRENSGDETHPVGQKKPNGIGLYDMTGNVTEWTDSRMGDKNEKRVLLGGNWGLPADAVRQGVAQADMPDDRHAFIGFRCAQ